MALDSASTIGIAIATAIKGITIPQKTAIDDAKLQEIWTAVSVEIRSQLTSKLQATAPTGGSAHPVGGIVPIIINAGEFS